MPFPFRPVSVCSRPPGGRAFTLLELLAVIAIIAVLCGLVLGVGRRSIATGQVARAKSELAALAVALEEYRRICGDYPRTGAGDALLQSLIGRQGPLGDSVSLRSVVDVGRLFTDAHLDPFSNPSAVLIDPWGRPYRYCYKTQSPWTNSCFVLYSTGPDGRDSAALTAGGFADPSQAGNSDNLYADLQR